MIQDAQTLTQRLAAGRLPLADTLRYALQIADSLRHAHEQGLCHGALTPDDVLLNPDGVELTPAQPGAVEALTPYTAPERLKGQGPDSRTDIYALGAILYEMLTGRRAFDAPTAEELAAVIENSLPAPIGETALDRLVLNCLVKEPAGRWQRVQQVHMEIKILTFSARRAQASGTPRPETASMAEVRQLGARLNERTDQTERAIEGLQRVASDLTSRLERHDQALTGLQQTTADLPQLESRLTSRLERHEQALTGLQQATADVPQLESRLTSRLEQHEQALTGLQQTTADLPTRLEQHDQVLTSLQHATVDLPQLESRLTERLDQTDRVLTGLHQVAAELPQFESRLTPRLDQHEQALTGLQRLATEQSTILQITGQTLDGIESRIGSLELLLVEAHQKAERAAQAADQITEGARRESAGLQVSLAGELHALELTVKAQGAAIESIRGAMARTDDFMERVVEALESLQTMVLDRAGDRTPAGVA